LAAATAVRDARAGQRVLVVSTDQAHSLGDVLGTKIVPSGERRLTRVLADDADAGGGFLDALALDTLALLETRWRGVAGLLAGRFPESDLGDVAPEELSALPGIQEVLGLYEVGELAAAGE
jgi:arsenite-transporting ATPase